jgi:hypothetical protein
MPLPTSTNRNRSLRCNSSINCATNGARIVPYLVDAFAPLLFLGTLCFASRRSSNAHACRIVGRFRAARACCRRWFLLPRCSRTTASNASLLRCLTSSSAACASRRCAAAVSARQCIDGDSRSARRRTGTVPPSVGILSGLTCT